MNQQIIKAVIENLTQKQSAIDSCIAALDRLLRTETGKFQYELPLIAKRRRRKKEKK